MSAVTEERSHGNEMPGVRACDVEAEEGEHTQAKHRREHDKLPSLMPISAILLYTSRSEGTRRGFLGLSFSLLPSYSQVYKAVRHIYRVIYVHAYTGPRDESVRKPMPSYPSSLLAKCLHALFEANVHEILMYSHIPVRLCPLSTATTTLVVSFFFSSSFLFRRG